MKKTTQQGSTGPLLIIGALIAIFAGVLFFGRQAQAPTVSGVVLPCGPSRWTRLRYDREARFGGCVGDHDDGSQRDCL